MTRPQPTKEDLFLIGLQRSAYLKGLTLVSLEPWSAGLGQGWRVTALRGDHFMAQVILEDLITRSPPEQLAQWTDYLTTHMERVLQKNEI